MAYTTRDKIESNIDPRTLIEALDDDEDGLEDEGAFDRLVESVSEDIDGLLEGRYAVPFADGAVPRVVSSAAKVFVLETLFLKRGMSEDTEPKNPWSSQAGRLRSRLMAIGNGDEPLRPTTKQATPAVDAVTEESGTFSSSGRLPA